MVQSVGARQIAEGYVNAEAIDHVQQKVDLYVAISGEDNNYRRYDYRPPKETPAKKVVDPRLIAMRKKATWNRASVPGRRAASVEPVIGIIKSAMGLRQFLLRGMAKVRIEWDLVCLAYNMRRLWSLTSQKGPNRLRQISQRAFLGGWVPKDSRRARPGGERRLAAR